MVIVHVLSSFGLGGQERVAVELASGQVRRGHRAIAVSLAPLPEGPLAEEFRRAGVAAETVDKRRDGVDPGLVVRLRQKLRSLGAEVVHTHNPMALIYGAPAAKSLGLTTVHTKHGANPASRGQKLLRRQIARMVDGFVAVSPTTAEQAARDGDRPGDDIQVITNGIQLDRFHPDAEARTAIRAELGIPASAWVVGTVGRLDSVKNQAMLVAAMAPLLSDRVRLIIVGDGPVRAVLEAAIARLPTPGYATLTGRRMDVNRLLAAFDVFALSSKSEGLPLVIPEAMATGLPIVTTAVGGLTDVIEDGVTGLIVPVDEGALRAALAALEADRDKARRLGDQARHTALSRYSSERMLDQYLALYQRR